MKGGTCRWDLGVLVGFYPCLAQNEGEISFLGGRLILARKDTCTVCPILWAKTFDTSW
jgi:hypothetical protein